MPIATKALALFQTEKNVNLFRDLTTPLTKALTVRFRRELPAAARKTLGYERTETTISYPVVRVENGVEMVYPNTVKVSSSFYGGLTEAERDAINTAISDIVANAQFKALVKNQILPTANL